MSKVEQLDSYVMVGAIDFGTTFSGYAFSFKSEPDNIKMNKNWGENLGFQSYKTPTSVLVDDKGNYVAFGFEAEQKYSDAIEEEGTKYHIYRHFKMLLHNTGVTRQTCITSVDGLKCKALDIFVMSLRYLKDHLLAALTQQTSNPTARLIKWIITVPAIWGDNAKQFMREAALQASLIHTRSSRNLEIALEPEAASMCCRSLNVDGFAQESSTDSGFKRGVKYLVIDAGGGTVDITAHEVLSEGRVKEIYRANGGPWGGTNVDKEFLQLLMNIFGACYMESYQRDCPRQFLDLMLKFESAKKAVNPDKSRKITLPLTWHMANKFQNVTGKCLEQTIKAASALGVSFVSGSLAINQTL